MATSPKSQEPTDQTYRIDDLARVAGTTVRNVRAYQERKLLHPPSKQGRSAIYSHSHLARLRLITTLLDRGFTLASIGELLEAWEQGHELADILGFERAITDPWVDDEPEYTTLAELSEMFGLQPDFGAMAQIHKAVEARFIALDATGVKILSPTLLRVGVELYDMGIPIDAILDELMNLRSRTDAIAKGFIDLAADHVFVAMLRDRTPQVAKKLTADAWQLRDLAMQVAQIEVARSLENQIRDKLSALLSSSEHDKS